ncbi:hypothetical protein SeV_B1118 [Salmonella enterica subsp. enterica serovar Virchow str. SL491]|uniref:Uncharacterized protein n=5 Tax=Enterobacterales TaxID=91347 RepID=A0A2R4PF04_ECOLX|nr:hypothetical protein [Enterobacter cloacae]AOA49182.1 hypothetical protein [Citrobacter freundii]AVX50250.1 hypothetical protein [Escherichia coli]AWM63826.1 Hypothetical protein [Providencia rettgeri]EDZ04392.1 hypothetical protein SeV_B1118 [Salmonella enterica subsp. enterica serovar Virchow str. SL491]QUW40714.1 hypothetical protein [Raoultella ornithinolytica]UUW42253.1 hypothetical protein [Klebsiella michiganensis]
MVPSEAYEAATEILRTAAKPFALAHVLALSPPLHRVAVKA